MNTDYVTECHIRDNKLQKLQEEIDDIVDWKVNQERMERLRDDKQIEKVEKDESL